MVYGGLHGALTFALVVLLDENIYTQRHLLITTTVVVICVTNFLLVIIYWYICWTSLLLLSLKECKNRGHSENAKPVQRNHYLFTHLTYVLLIHNLGKHWM